METENHGAVSFLLKLLSALFLLSSEKLQSFSPDLPKKALELYPPSAPCPTRDRCPERAYTTMVSDIRVTCPNNDLAWRAAGKQQPGPKPVPAGEWGGTRLGATRKEIYLFIFFFLLT